MTIVTKGIMNLMTQSKCMKVVVKPVMGYWNHIAMARSYGVLNQGEPKIDVFLRNHSAKQITLPKQTVVGEITAANIITVLLVQRPMGHESD